MTTQCEPMVAGEGGWSDWVHPIPGYRMQCCDCGLIHDMEFQIADPAMSTNGVGALSPGEDAEAGVVIFRARRAASPPPAVSVEEVARVILREAFQETERAIDACAAANLWPWQNATNAARTILGMVQGEKP